MAKKTPPMPVAPKTALQSKRTKPSDGEGLHSAHWLLAGDLNLDVIPVTVDGKERFLLVNPHLMTAPLAMFGRAALIRLRDECNVALGETV